MANNLKKRLNLVLTNGLVVVSAKFRKDSPVVVLFVTDFTHDTRILFDLEKKALLANRDNIVLTAKDNEAIIAALPKYEEVQEKKAQASFLDRAKAFVSSK